MGGQKKLRGERNLFRGSQRGFKGESKINFWVKTNLFRDDCLSEGVSRGNQKKFGGGISLFRECLRGY